MPSPTPRSALSVPSDFDPELQSRLRTGRPRTGSLPSGDRTLGPQQLPLLQRFGAPGDWGQAWGHSRSERSSRCRQRRSALEPDAGDNLAGTTGKCLRLSQPQCPHLELGGPSSPLPGSTRTLKEVVSAQGLAPNSAQQVLSKW